jgi:hypothetical protein
MKFSLHISYKNFVFLSHLLHACYIPNPYHSAPQSAKWPDYMKKDTGSNLGTDSRLSVVKSVHTVSGSPTPQFPLPVGTVGSFLEGKSAGTWSWQLMSINRLTPNDLYMSRTAPLTSKRCILYIYSTNTGTEYFKHALYSPFFSLQIAVCFVMLTCLVPVLFTFYIQNVLKL